MKKIELLIILFACVLVGSSNPAHADDLVLGVWCDEQGGYWDPPPANTCTIYEYAIINMDETLALSFGETIDNYGTIENYGNIALDTGFIFNLGDSNFDNLGTINIISGWIDNYSNFINSSIINNDAYILSSGIFSNTITSKIENNHEIRNYDNFINKGDIYNNNIIENHEKFYNDNVIVNNNNITNDGQFYNNYTIHINETGTITNTYTIENNGFIDNDGKINNKFPGSLTNNGSITINNDSSIANEGFIVNNMTGSIENHGSLDNHRSYSNRGTFNNAGTFVNHTFGTVLNSVSGIVHNHGTIINYFDIANYGTINNYCDGTYTGTLPSGNPIVNYIFCFYVPITRKALYY